MSEIVKFNADEVMSRVLYDPAVQAPFMDFCATIAKSAGIMVPVTLNTPEKVFAAMVTGHELGFSSMQSCRSVYVVNGNVELKASAMEALLERHGVRRKIVEWTPARCAIEFTRGDRVETFDYTMDEAVQAGDATKGKENGKDNMYVKRPKDMLYARALSRGARKMAPDILTGIYVEGEMPRETVDSIGTLTALSTPATEKPAAIEAEFQAMSNPEPKK